MDYMDGLEVSHCFGVVYQEKKWACMSFYIIIPAFDASCVYRTIKLRAVQVGAITCPFNGVAF